MSDLVTVRGFVASEVRTTLSESGCPVAHFRLASTNRKFDRQRREWIDAQTNWYSVSMFRSLAQNASVSVSKGERVIVTGRLKLRQWSKEDGRRGIAPEIDADAVGHDLSWGTARFSRAMHVAPVSESSSEGSGSDRADPQVLQELVGSEEDGFKDGAIILRSEPSDTGSEVPF